MARYYNNEIIFDNTIKYKGTGNPTTDTDAEVGEFYLNTNTGEFFACNYKNDIGKTRWKGSNGHSVGYPVGQALFTSSGTFTVPAGVTQISAVAVGGGGGGHFDWANKGGGGGALAYAHDIEVTPGETISITVGAGGLQSSNGGNSMVGTYFGAKGGVYSCTSTSTRAVPIAGSITPKGGAGGMSSGSSAGGGGGAGGYGTTFDGMTARGGDGLYGGSVNWSTGGASNDNSAAYYGNGTNGAGGGGAGYQSSTYGHGGGGGVGLYGRGNSGIAGTNSQGNSFYASIYNGGKGGSGGAPGAGNNNSSETISGEQIAGYTAYHGCGGKFGGGGGGGGTSTTNNSSFCRGGQGAVRIIWGGDRDFINGAPDMTPEQGIEL